MMKNFTLNTNFSDNEVLNRDLLEKRLESSFRKEFRDCKPQKSTIQMLIHYSKSLEFYRSDAMGLIDMSMN